jgi:hypothetical protein
MPDRALGRNLAQVNRAHAGLEKITVAATFAAKPLIVGADSVRLADRASFIAQVVGLCVSLSASFGVHRIAQAP